MLKELWSASVVSCLMKTAFQKREKGSAVLREPTLTDRRLHRFDTQSAYLREVCYLEVRQEETEDTYIVHFCKPLIYCNFTYHCTHCCALVFVFLATKTTWSGSTKPLGLLQMIRWFSAYKCWNSALTPPTSPLPPDLKYQFIRMLSEWIWPVSLGVHIQIWTYVCVVYSNVKCQLGMHDQIFLWIIPCYGRNR